MRAHAYTHTNAHANTHTNESTRKHTYKHGEERRGKQSALNGHALGFWWLWFWWVCPSVYTKTLLWCIVKESTSQGPLHSHGV